MLEFMKEHGVDPALGMFRGLLWHALQTRDLTTVRVIIDLCLSDPMKAAKALEDAYDARIFEFLLENKHVTVDSARKEFRKTVQHDYLEGATVFADSTLLTDWYYEMTELLPEHLDAQTASDLLHIAALKGDRHTAKFLLRQGCLSGEGPEKGAFTIAAYTGQMNLIQFLLQNFHHTRQDPSDAKRIAHHSGCEEMAEFLNDHARKQTS